MYLAFASPQKKKKKKKKRKEEKERKEKRMVANKVIGMWCCLQDCLIPPMRFLWGLLSNLKLWCEVVTLALVVEVFFAH